MMSEDECYRLLSKHLDEKSISVQQDKIRLIPNYRQKDSPDYVLEITLTLNLLSQRMNIVLNIPIELEKAGLKQALLDLEKFVKREKFVNEFPMMVIANNGFAGGTESWKLLTEFIVKQIPERLI